MKIKHFLVLALLFTKLVATTSVDSQVAAWEEVWKTARSTPGFSWRETHVPGLIDRIAYIADYVKNAIWGDAEREATISTVMQKTGDLEASSSLTFQQTFDCIEFLAMICDKTIPVKISEDPLSVSFFENNLGDLPKLDEFNVLVICSRNGGLSLDRILNGYFHDHPLLYLSLPNHTLVKGVHGGTCTKIYDFYKHDIEHATAFIRRHIDLPFEIFRPIYKKIAQVRNSLPQDSRERRIVDAFLFKYLHEDLGSLYEKTDYEEETKLIQRIETGDT